ncbi:cysteine protease domain, YopT-type [Gardnerella vaginalis JCP8481A]|nr:FIVAR domain-containing protein [Gardnerella vaginalis]EPI42662.1 cysteine protease domain, YopT-type [Gardnerella vaginalis JCP8481B]EPI42927.1 cysteine protease domain, YopT-type [Gardnerella vaginalis JCP8481A]
MINANSGRHAHSRKVTLDATASNAIQKAIDARKVAAFTIGAAGVLAGAAFAFGATPAMAAETAATTPATPATVTASTGSAATSAASSTASADTGTATDNQDANKNTENVSKTAEKKAENAKPAEKKDGNSATTDTDKTNAASSATEETTAKKRVGRSLDPETPAPVDQNRASNGGTNEVAFSSQTGGMPNVYGFGTVDNQYDEQLANNPIIFKLPKQQDANGADKAVTRVAVFPSTSNHINTKKTAGSIDFDSDNGGHQPYSGEYVFKQNVDGSATLTMNRIFRKDERSDSKAIKNAQGYSATRSIQINPIPVQGSAKEDAVSDQFRAALLVPPQSAGTIVKKVSDADITDTDVNNAMDDAKKNGKTTHVGKSGIDGLSLEAQIQALSKVGKRKLDTIDKKIPTGSNEYDKNALTKANSKVGVSIVNTHFVTDLGFKSQDIPLTIVRYNDVIDKPIVEDPTKLSQDVKNEIATKLAKINGVSTDKITFDGDNTVIHFDGVDENDAPKIDLRDLVLKKLKDSEYKVPSDAENSTVKAVVVANPLGYSQAELQQIKKAIYEANKDNQELGLSEKDYEKQISLGWVTGDTTASGGQNTGISNGMNENKITVTIKTDKAYAQFKSDIQKHELTRLIDLRKDYTLSWEDGKNKISGRTSDEGLAWMEDGKTLVYRYDPDKGEQINTQAVLDLLKATVKSDVKADNPQLRDNLLGTEITTVKREGVKGQTTRSHRSYTVDDKGEPIGVLNLVKLNGGGYGGFAKPVDNSNKKMGDEQSSVNDYTFDDDSQKVSVAGKNGKCMIGRLFIEPYSLYYYNYVYGENKYNLRNTPKGVNVVFVPQTNHKIKDLNKSIGEHKLAADKKTPIDSAYYNASDKVKKDYEDALKVAQDTLTKVGSTADADLSEALKAEVDNATIKLDKARAALDGDATNKKELNKSIDANGKAKEGQTAEVAGTVTTDKYKNVTDQAFQTDDGKLDAKKNEDAKKAKTAYDEALAAAEKVKADDNATQKAVDDAKAKLDAARKELDKYSTNKDKLNAAIAEHGKVKDGRDAHGTQTLANADPAYQNATEKERKAYDAAVKKANDLSADPNASQKEVNEAITALENAKKALDAKATDKSQLITAEKLTFDNPDKDDADRQSTFYKNALNKQTNGANDQEKQAAKTAVENYDNALKKAREVLKNDKATQAEVDAAKDALTNAEKVLHEKYATNADELTKVLADNFSGYLMPAYFNAFDKAHAGDKDAADAFKNYNDAYQKAKALKEKLEKAKNGGTAPDQTQINEAQKALEEARKVIDKLQLIPAGFRQLYLTILLYNTAQHTRMCPQMMQVQMQRLLSRSMTPQ